MDKNKQEELQQKYLEFQMIGEQMKQLQQQAQLLDEQTGELNITLQGLEDLKKAKQEEILVPIATGIFTKAKLVADKDLIVNVGGNVLVKKDVLTTIKMTQDRIKSVADYQANILENLQKISLRARQLEEELLKHNQG